MNAKWVLLVSVLIIAFAMYLHEHHLSTLVKLFRTSTYFNSFMVSIHNVLTGWIGGNIARSPKGTNLKNSKTSVVFTADHLRQFNGERGLYLSILGKVYDVGKGNKHYKPGADYHVFTGRDASRAFLTGDFTEAGLTDEVLDLTLEDLKSIYDWAKFYKKQYKYKGKLVGLYYDASGNATPYLLEVQAKIKQAKAKEADVNNRKLEYPPCNIEWNHDTGSRVWCSTKSGGIERDWVGVPRKYYEPGSTTFRCACVNLVKGDKSTLSGNVREYEDCDPVATTCYMQT